MIYALSQPLGGRFRGIIGARVNFVWLGV